MRTANGKQESIFRVRKKQTIYSPSFHAGFLDGIQSLRNLNLTPWPSLCEAEYKYLQDAGTKSYAKLLEKKM